MAVSYRAIGRNIRNARLTLHLTQEQAAELANISLLHYGRLERGERRASLDQLECFAKLLKTSLEALLCGASDSLSILSPTPETQQECLFSSLAAGCSREAQCLMIDVCRLIAASDKYSSI